MDRCTFEAEDVPETPTERECKRWVRVVIRRIETAELSMEAARIDGDEGAEVVLWAVGHELRTMLRELGAEEVAAQCTTEP